MTRPNLLLASVSGLTLALLLSGCTYDYMQHSDQVGYHAGDAVKANLASSTIDPAKKSTYSKKGLGRNGDVIPEETPAATTVVSATP